MTNAQLIYDRSPVWVQNLMLNAFAAKIERHRYGSAYRDAVAELEAQERWPLDRVREHQDSLLRAVMRAAYEGSRYYRDVMTRAGLRPDDIRGVHDLQKLPLLEKDVV